MPGKPVRPEDLEHELPEAQEGDGHAETSAARESGAPASLDPVQQLKAERDSLYDRLARAQAEFDNYRKRAAREQQDFREYATADAVRSLLPVLDSLDLALKNSRGQKSELHSGVELTRRQLAEALAKLGLTEVPATGERFDPQWHQAIEMVETTEAPDHQVIDELQRGYKFKDRLLRPAMVRVAKNP